MASFLPNHQKIRKSLLILGPACLALLILFPYGQMHTHEFINWDDPFYIYKNPVVSHGLSWQGIGWAFTTGTTANWHPLTWISHMLDSSLFGPVPAGAHLVNLGWYIGCVILTFFLFLRLGASPGAAFFMSAFFGLHPLHVESVAWASERKDLLCAFFFLSATLAYLQYSSKRNGFSYLFTTGLFGLALLSKPMAVTWPCVALLLDFWPVRRLNRSSFKIICEKIPWLILSVFSSLVTIFVQSKSEAVKSLLEFPFADRLANAFIAYRIYLQQNFWPADLTVFYPYPDRISPYSLITSCLVLAVITWIALRQRARHPYVLWGWLFYLGVLLPVIGLVQVGVQTHADRYMLLPHLGIVVAAGFLLDNILTGEKIRKGAGYALCIILAILMLLTFRQVSYWKNTETLFNQNLKAAGENDLAHFNLGSKYLENNRLELALIHLSASAQMNPHDPITYNNLGILYMRQSHDSLAEACFRRAIVLHPEMVQPYFNLAAIKTKQRLFEEATQYMNEVARLAPDDEEARKRLDKLAQALLDLKKGTHEKKR
jgi:hypothetical protein